MGRDSGLAHVTLIWSVGAQFVEVSFPEISRWSGRRVYLPKSLLRALPPDSGAMNCNVRSGHAAEECSGVRVLRSRAQLAFSAGRVTRVLDDEVVVEWLEAPGQTTSLPLAMFASTPAPDDNFEVEATGVRQPEIPPFGD